MKVGTDGVLLGAWVENVSHGTVLDVGCGSGVISLILAQRFPCINIQAIDISIDAVAETQLNMANSPWSSRTLAFKGDAKSFSFQGVFDLVISNPPFFSNATKSGKATRDLTRHDDTLAFEDLLAIVNKYLTPKGRMAVVYPFDRLETILRSAKNNGFSPIRTCLVKPKPHLAANRVLLEFGRLSQNDSETHQRNELIIREADNSFSSEYQALTRSLYLAF